MNKRQSLINKLSAFTPQKKAIMLALARGLNISAVARAVNCSRGQVYSVLKRADCRVLVVRLQIEFHASKLIVAECNRYAEAVLKPVRKMLARHPRHLAAFKLKLQRIDAQLNNGLLPLKLTDIWSDLKLLDIFRKRSIINTARRVRHNDRLYYLHEGLLDALETKGQVDTEEQPSDATTEEPRAYEAFGLELPQSEEWQYQPWMAEYSMTINDITVDRGTNCVIQVLVAEDFRPDDNALTAVLSQLTTYVHRKLFPPQMCTNDEDYEDG